MPWATTDKQNLWAILNLDRNQLMPNSALSVAMERVEQFDVDYQTTLVEEAQTIIADLSALETDLRTQRAATKLKSEESYLAGSETYVSGDDAFQALLYRKNELIQRLRKILDFDPLFSGFGIGDLIESS